MDTSKKVLIENKLKDVSLKNVISLQHNNTSSPSHHEQILNVNKPNEELLSIGKASLNLEELYEYLNKNIENLKMNLEFKSFALKNDSLLFKKSLLREFQKNVSNSNSRCYDKKYTGNETNLEEITNKAIIDTLQDLIDEGKIQHAFLIYSTFKNRINVPDKTLRSWSHGYLGGKFF